MGRGATSVGAAFLAGAINSVAGGGTLVSFPALIWLGLNSVAANATSTVAIWPGTVGSAWGYRRELRAAEPRFRVLIVPSLIGGITGAVLLHGTRPEFFDKLVPYLILFATLLFMAQARVQRALGTAKVEGHRTGKWLAGAMLFQLAVGLYGGYFGAGIGILMLAALSILGLKDIHEMNALKVVLGGVINGIAAVYFVVARMVYWPYVLIMVAGVTWATYSVAQRRAARRSNVSQLLSPIFVVATLVSALALALPGAWCDPGGARPDPRPQR